MTLQEVSILLNKSESTLMTNFLRTQKNLEKKGIILIKKGEGRKADYQIIYKEENNNG